MEVFGTIASACTDAIGRHMNTIGSSLQEIVETLKKTNVRLEQIEHDVERLNNNMSGIRYDGVELKQSS